ncbi:MAG: IS630 transposase-related protein [Chloroflexota bacterium]|jgi:transposase|nr:IS630 transposase-related protein [Chloroflexota bacterium]
MTYSLDLRQRVVTALERGQSVSAVSRLFDLARSTVIRYRDQHQQTGQLAARTSPGRPALITAEQYPELEAQLTAHPDSTLDAHCQHWAERTGVVLSRATLSRTLQRLGWSYKKRRWQPVSKTPSGASAGEMSSPRSRPSDWSSSMRAAPPLP